MSEKKTQVKFGFFLEALEGVGVYEPEESFRVANIVQWLKNIGDKVKKGDPLAVIETDKVSQDLESPTDGVLLSRNYEEGDNWEYGGTEETALGTLLIPHLGIIETDQQNTEAETETPKEKAEAKLPKEPKSVPRETKSPSIPAATTAAREIAREMGIDLKDIAGSGDEGLILVKDVEAAGEQITEEPASPDRQPTNREPDRTLIKASSLRREMARLMERSWREIPHAGDTLKVNVSSIVAFKNFYSKIWESITGAKLRYDHFFLFLATRLLKREEFKILNGYWDKEQENIFVFEHVNLGIATQTPGGLIVPVVHEAEGLSFMDLVKKSEDLFRKAKAGELKISEIRDLTFTINNTGVYGGHSPSSIIPFSKEKGGNDRPTAAIISLGQISQDFPQQAEWHMNLTIRFDHRLLDGVPAIPFLKAMKDYIESKKKVDEFLELLNPDFSL